MNMVISPHDDVGTKPQLQPEMLPRTPAEVAAFQVSSPDFADFCVMHLTDPAFGYLFSKSAAGRQEYETALAALSAPTSTMASASNNNNNALPSSSTAANSATSGAPAG